MPRRLNLEITETQEELKILLSEQRTGFGKERVQALYLLKLGQVTTVGELAEWLARHRVTVQKWLALYRRGGMSVLLRYKPSTGRPSSIPQWAVKALKKRLQDPKGFRSYGAVQQWLKETLGINASYQAVYELVRHKLKAKLKVGKRQNTEQDPEQVQQFKAELADNLMLLQDVCQHQFGMEARQWRKRVSGRNSLEPDYYLPPFNHGFWSQTRREDAVGLPGVLVVWDGRPAKWCSLLLGIFPP
jgi:transposase